MKIVPIFRLAINKKCIFLFVIHFLIFNGFAQVPLERVYTTVPNPGSLVHQSLVYIAKVPSTNSYYGVGNYNPNGVVNTDDWLIKLWKLNEWGDTVWVKTLTQLNPEAYWVAVDGSIRTDGGMFVLYRQHNYGHSFNGVIRFTSSGNTHWSVPVSIQNNNAIGRFTKVVTTPDGGCIACGATSYFPSQPFVVKISSSGMTDWGSSSFTNESGYSKFNDACATTDNCFMLTGLIHNNADSKNSLFVVKLSPAGSIMWNLVVHTGLLTSGDSTMSEGISIVPAPHGGAIVTGYKTTPGTTNKDAWVFHIDSLGTWPPVWQKTIGVNAHNNGRGEKILKASDGNYLLYTSDNNGNPNNITRLFKLNPSGNILWSQVGYYNYNEYHLTPCSITNNDEVLFCGTSSINPGYARFTHPTSDGVFRAPKLSLPENNAQNQPTSLTLAIHTPSNIHHFSRYWYQLCTDSNFNEVLINHVVDADTIIISNLSSNTTYFWRVKGFGIEMKTTQWSERFQFTTGNGNIGVSETPDSPFLVSIFPNPVQSRMTISYNLNVPSHVRMILYNSNGVLIDAIETGFQEPGTYSQSWERRDLPGGFYFVLFLINNKPMSYQSVIFQ